MRGLGPGELAERLAVLPVVIEKHSVQLGSVPVTGYYGGIPRPTGEVVLQGGGFEGRGENIDWYPEEQEGFPIVCDELVPRMAPRGKTTAGEVSLFLLESGAHPYHRAAIEAAAIELALGQASTDLFQLSDRPVRPVRFCWSLGLEVVRDDGPFVAIERLLAAHPEARVKIDCPSGGWSSATWRALATTGRIVIVDFKREGSTEQAALAHHHLPEAWLEDPPLVHSDPHWLCRVALDGYVVSATALDTPPLPPAAVNVKAPRVGGLLEALRCLERCAREGWQAYVGGMFEVGVGRRQARDLASLFTPDAWNDLAPLGAAEGPQGNRLCFRGEAKLRPPSRGDQGARTRSPRSR